MKRKFPFPFSQQLKRQGESFEKLKGVRKRVVLFLFYRLPETFYQLESCSSNVPIFDMLSPHHKLDIFAKLFVGLCCKNEPLPKYSFENQAGCYMLVDFFRMLLEVEGDLEHDGESYHKCHEVIKDEVLTEKEIEETKKLHRLRMEMHEKNLKEENKMKELIKKETGSCDISSTISTMSSGYLEVERKQERLNKKIRKKEGKIPLDTLKKNIDTEYQKINQKMMEKLQRKPKIVPDYLKWLLKALKKKRRVVKTSPECYCFDVRKKLCELVKDFGFEVNPTFFTSKETDIWFALIEFFKGYLFPVSKPHMFWTGELSKCNKIKYEYVIRTVKELSIKFEKKWKPWRTQKAIMTLTYFNPERSESISEYSAIKEELRKMENEFKKLQEINTERIKSEKNDSERVVFLLERAKLMLKHYQCLLQYHSSLGNISKRKIKSLSLEKKYNAFKQIKTKDCMWYYGKIECHEANLLEHPKIFRIEQNSRFMRLCGNYEKCKQKETIENRFKKCSACNVVRYCSKKCQKECWRVHRIVCKKWGEEYQQDIKILKKLEFE